MLQTISMQSLVNLLHREGHHFEFQSSGEWKSLKYRNEVGPTCHSQQPIKTLAPGYGSPARARAIAASHPSEARASSATRSTPALTAPTCPCRPYPLLPMGCHRGQPLFRLPARPPQLSSASSLPPRSTSTQTGTSGHGIASPTPPRAPLVLRTSLRAMSQAPPPPDDALHAVPLRPPTHRRGACSTVSFSLLQPLNRAPPLAGLLLDLFPHRPRRRFTGIDRSRHLPAPWQRLPCPSSGLPGHSRLDRPEAAQVHSNFL
jgi:hypothetical protein